MADWCNVQVSGKTWQCFQSGKTGRETSAHDARAEGIARSRVWVPPLWALSAPRVWGAGQVLANACGRVRVTTHKRSYSAPRWAQEALFLSHAALKSDGWYRKTKSCSFPVVIKVFFVRQ